MDVAPAPVLAGLRGLDHRVRALAEVRGGVLPRRGVAAADQRRSPGTAAAPPSGCPRRGRAGRRRLRGVSTAGCCSRSWQDSPPGRRTAFTSRSSSWPWWACSSIDSSTSSIDEHLADHLGGDRAVAADLQHPAALGVDHRPPGPGVQLGRASPGRRPSRAAPRRRSSAGRRAGGSCRRPRAGPRTRAGRAPRSPAFDACCRIVARASASSIGSGDGTRSRRATQPQGEALEEQGAGHRGERDQQQDLAVVGLRSG